MPQLPETIIGTALGSLPSTLSQRANAGDREGIGATAGWAMRSIRHWPYPHQRRHGRSVAR